MAVGALRGAVSTSQVRGVLSGAAAAVSLTAAWIVFAYALWPAEPVLGTTPIDRLSQAFSWQPVALVPLLFGTIVVAWRRLASGAIGTSGPAAGAPLVFALAFARSTLHQTVLLVVGHLGFSLVAAPLWLPLIPMLVVVYVVGRGVLWLGDGTRPAAIGFAFGTSVLPTGILILVAAWRVLAIHAEILAFGSTS